MKNRGLFAALTLMNLLVIVPDCAAQFIVVLDDSRPISAGDALRALLASHIFEEDFHAVLHVVQRQITTFPTGSSAGSFVYKFDPALGLPVRRSQSFGPVFADRPLTAGRHRLSFSFATQHTSWKAIAGQQLSEGIRTENVFVPPASLAGFIGVSQHAVWETTKTTMQFSTRRVLFGINFGLSERLDVGVIVPYGDTEVSGETSITSYDLTALARIPTCASCIFTVSGRSSGIGDVIARAKYSILSRGPFDLAIASDFRLPTGDAKKLLGSGAYEAKGALVGSVAQGRLTHHFAVGYAIVPGSATNEEAAVLEDTDPIDPLFDEVDEEIATRQRQPDEFNYALGVDIAVRGWLTVAGDIIGRSLLSAGNLTISRSVLSTTVSVEPATVNLLLGAASMKILVLKSWLLTASMAFPMNSAGFKPGITPVIGFERAF